MNRTHSTYRSTFARWSALIGFGLSALLSGCGAGTSDYGQPALPTRDSDSIRADQGSSWPEPQPIPVPELTAPDGTLLDPRSVDSLGSTTFETLATGPASLAKAFVYDKSGAPSTVTGQATGAIDRAMAAWGSAVAMPSLMTCVTGTVTVVDRDGVNTITWADLGPDKTSVVNLYLGGGRVVEADILLNTTANWAVNPPLQPGETRLGVPGAYDVQAVMSHQLGHALGLADITDADLNSAPDAVNATMWHTILPGELAPQTLSAGDVAGAQLMVQ